MHAGVFLGTAIHDTSQVIGAALIYSQQAAAPAALAAASVAKLLRNLSIAVLIPVAAWLTQRHEARSAPDERDAAGDGARWHAPPLVPLFVLAFIGFIVLRTAGDALLHTPRLAGAGQHRLHRLGSVPHLRHDGRGPVGVFHRHVAHRLAARWPPASCSPPWSVAAACCLNLAMLHWLA